MCVNVPKKVEMFETLNHVQQHGQTMNLYAKLLKPKLLMKPVSVKQLQTKQRTKSMQIKISTL